MAPSQINRDVPQRGVIRDRDLVVSPLDARISQPRPVSFYADGVPARSGDAWDPILPCAFRPPCRKPGGRHGFPVGDVVGAMRCAPISNSLGPLKGVPHPLQSATQFKRPRRPSRSSASSRAPTSEKDLGRQIARRSCFYEQVRVPQLIGAHCFDVFGHLGYAVKHVHRSHW